MNDTCRRKTNGFGCKVYLLWVFLVVEVLVFVKNYAGHPTTLMVLPDVNDHPVDKESNQNVDTTSAVGNITTTKTTTTTATTTTTTTSTVKKIDPRSLCGNDFVWLEDRDVPSFESISKQRKIPNVLYQTGPSRCVSKGMYEDSISKWNGVMTNNLSYRFYDDAAMDKMLYDPNHHEAFPLLPLALRCIEHVNTPVMKADLWRYLVLWQHGGIFADLDAVPLEGFTNSTIEAHHDAVFVPVRTAKSDVVSQWFFGVSPQHPVMHYALQTGINLLLQSKMALPTSTTGPNALYYATGKFLGGKESWRRVPPGTYSYFRNNSNNNNTKNRSFVVLPRNIAKNRASASKKQSYKAMNMTHYFGKQNGLKFGGKTCMEFVGAVPTTSDGEESLMYKGRKYSLKVREVDG
jgi:hypothetical protein